MTATPLPPLSSGTLDRDAATRTDSGLLAAAWSDPAARLLALRGSRVPVLDAAADGGARLALSPVRGAFGDEHAYLGRLDGAPVFVEFGAADDGDAQRVGASVSWVNPLELEGLRSDGERELMTAGLALAAWHRSAGFSPADGRPTHPSWGGWSRTDPDGALLFPRTDPAVIVLVEHEGRALLGSNALWETGRFSLLAGFVDAGESAEQAVVREIREEAGVPVDRIRYIASQPWPFPRSLMLGFHASLQSGFDPEALAPDPEEISELRWFTRDELRTPPPGVRLPGPLSIARWLIDRWVDEA
ncbi:NAD(+) diphosphatase [Leucobacter iarius]|uniref:NAD(+) diphosphatase n=1 Tax=Leucobacter iarius TaxID=333963 RepID=A0ABP4XMU3_9MICO